MSLTVGNDAECLGMFWKFLEFYGFFSILGYVVDHPTNSPLTNDPRQMNEVGYKPSCI